MVAQCLRRADAARATAVACMGRGARRYFAGGELPGAMAEPLALAIDGRRGLPICTRSGFLVSKHARELDQLLKGVPGPLGDIVHAG